jgi:hypothetical protein
LTQFLTSTAELYKRFNAQAALPNTSHVSRTAAVFYDPDGADYDSVNNGSLSNLSLGSMWWRGHAYAPDKRKRREKNDL